MYSCITLISSLFLLCMLIL
ncbi:hypothetical protein [Helicobacter pylori]